MLQFSPTPLSATPALQGYSGQSVAGHLYCLPTINQGQCAKYLPSNSVVNGEFNVNLRTPQQMTNCTSPSIALATYNNCCVVTYKRVAQQWTASVNHNRIWFIAGTRNCTCAYSRAIRSVLTCLRVWPIPEPLEVMDKNCAKFVCLFRDLCRYPI